MQYGSLQSAGHSSSEIEVLPLSLTDGAWLQRLLGLAKTDDIYARSSAYYGFTGRKGLSLISLGNDFAIAAAHPNNEQRRLLFHPSGNLNPFLLSGYINQVGKQVTDIARVSEKDAVAFVQTAKQSLPDWRIDLIDEDVLDWRYPVHTLDTSAIAAMSGSSFTDFRKNIHRAERLGLQSRAIKLPDDALILSRIVKRWANDAADRYGESEFLQDPYNFLLKNLVEFSPKIDGFIAFQGNDPIGFAMWQITDPEKGEAASLATVQCHPQKGVSEYLYREMGVRLLNEGIARVCIGGSETPGLDNFKLKMNPASSIVLKTIRLSPR